MPAQQLQKYKTIILNFIQHYITPWTVDGFSRLRAYHRKRFVMRTDHNEILLQVNEEGGIQNRYLLNIILSCAIATLGLLLSSPAVIIGAMLISPLMSPIMSLGFSLCVVDMRQMRLALEALIIGTASALVISFLIVKLSPLTAPTSEIMARTQPNLFDLLVAIFSGIAGGYATVKGKGGTIVGVAIATALMPPLAVVGYGIATWSWPITSGAFFLFMTNLLAIALTVTVIAKFYGFGYRDSDKNTLWQTAMVALTFLVLSIPLGISLKNIAQQTYATQTARSEIESYFSDKHAVLSNFSIKFNKNAPLRVTSVVITTEYKPGALDELKVRLEDKLRQDVNLQLDQIVAARLMPQLDTVVTKNENALTNPLQEGVDTLIKERDIAQEVHATVFFPVEALTVDSKLQQVNVLPAAASAPAIDVLYQVENKLAVRLPDWQIKIIPPSQPLPPVYFTSGKSDLRDGEAEKISAIEWALHRWGKNEVEVVGFASTTGEFQQFDNRSLAYRRAEKVSGILGAAGIKSRPVAEYRSYQQSQNERKNGLDSFQRVEVRVPYRQPD